MYPKSTIAVLCLLPMLFTTTALAQQRPNILLIMAEDMSARVGAFGDNVAVTPNLANNGARFTQVFTTAGVCAPSRAAHILAVHQMSVGAQHMRTRSFKESPYRSVPPAHIKAYPELLRRQGYYTFTSPNSTISSVIHLPVQDLLVSGTTRVRNLLGRVVQMVSHFLAS